MAVESILLRIASTPAGAPNMDDGDGRADAAELLAAARAGRRLR